MVFFSSSQVEKKKKNLKWSRKQNMSVIKTMENLEFTLQFCIQASEQLF